MKKDKKKLKEKKLDVNENEPAVKKEDKVVIENRKDIDNINIKDRSNMILKVIIAILTLLLIIGIGFDVSNYTIQDSEKEKNEEVEKNKE